MSKDDQIPPCERITFDTICAELSGHTINRVAGVLGSSESRWMCTNKAKGHSWFEITCWPGYLVMTGDRGEWVFSRHNTNMIGFFRNQGSGSGLDYVHEKLQAADVRFDVCEFSRRKWREVLEDELIECPNNYEGDEEEERSETLRDLMDEVPDCLERAYELLHDELEWYDDIPDLTDYSGGFVWAVRAIAWFARTVDIDGENAAHQAIVDAACVRVADAESYREAGRLAATAVPDEKLIDSLEYANGYSKVLADRLGEKLDAWSQSPKQSEVHQ